MYLLCTVDGTHFVVVIGVDQDVIDVFLPGPAHHYSGAVIRVGRKVPDKSERRYQCAFCGVLQENTMKVIGQLVGRRRRLSN